MRLEKTQAQRTQALLPLLSSLKSSVHKTRAAGNLTEAVDYVLEKVSNGDHSGGLKLITTNGNHN